MHREESIANYIINNKSKFYNRSNDEINRLFLNKLSKYHKDMSQEKIWINNDTYSYPKEIYSLNALEYRSPEFFNSPNTIFSGCSVTYGIGLEEKYIWPKLFIEKTNKDYVNLGRSGQSAPSVIDNLYSYFKEYGHPKNIYCLFPNFNRVTLPVNSNIHINNSNNINQSYIDDVIIDNFDLSNIPQYSKAPHILENILSIDITYWLSLRSIFAFEQYCKVAGINFVWSTWDNDLNQAIQIIKDKNGDYYESFINIQYDHSLDCHHKEKEENAFLWELAGDRHAGKNYAHPGIHFHIHVYESFLKFFNS